MRHLRHALEDDTDPTKNEEQTITMKGPLSQIYTDALAVAYAKHDPATGAVGLESQAMDAAYMARLASLIAPPEAVQAANTMVYGVSPVDLTQEEVVKVTQELADVATNDTPDHFVLIIDGTQEPVAGGDGIEQRYVDLAAGLESIATGFGIKVYHSLPEFAKTL